MLVFTPSFPCGGRCHRRIVRVSCRIDEVYCINLAKFDTKAATRSTLVGLLWAHRDICASRIAGSITFDRAIISNHESRGKGKVKFRVTAM
jgi:hypothetical protein